jgi:hypothetical protein
MFAVVRQSGSGAPLFLADVGRDQWGTTCTLSAAAALRFPTEADASAAARKATRVCMGWSHTNGREARPYPRVRFVAQPIA